MEAPENDLVKQKWYVINNDEVGGWSIANADKPVTKLNREDEIDFVDCISKDIADYIVGLHNGLAL